MTTSHHSPTNLSYAQALLDMATERNQAEPIGKEMLDLQEVVSADQSFKLFLSDPSISETHRMEVLQRALAGKVAPLVMNFLQLLNAKSRLRNLSEIAEAYDYLLDEKLGKIEVDVTVASKLSPEQLQQVQQRVSQALGKEAIVHEYVDERIIGGLVLRVQDRLIDASVRSQLQSMKEQLLGSVPK